MNDFLCVSVLIILSSIELSVWSAVLEHIISMFKLFWGVNDIRFFI